MRSAVAQRSIGKPIAFQVIGAVLAAIVMVGAVWLVMGYVLEFFRTL